MRYAVAVITEAGCLAMALLGETGVDSLAGSAGWLGAGLLGAVLAWLLLVHLPAKDKQLKELLDAKDRQTSEMLVNFTEATNHAQASFSARNDKTLDTFAQLTREERTLYQRWHEENRKILEQLVLEMRENRHALANLRHELGLKKAAERIKEEDGA